MRRVAILPYRKLGFAREFGFTVRDLMILRVLAALPQIAQIDWFERPGLPHEYLRDVLKGVPDVGQKVRVHGGLDLHLVGAFRHRRMWTHHAMARHEPGLRRWTQDVGTAGVLLDFNPFYRPPPDLVNSVFYWHDLIDTFTKHNRFSDREKTGVGLKYDFVRQHARLVTGVSPAAVAPFKGSVLANRLLRDSLGEAGHEPDFDLGYLGFITDKFDLAAVRGFAAQGLKILICGLAYDPAIAEALTRLPNVTYRGAFTSADAPALIGRFRVGMVPYRPELSHDESPIKFFQYLAHGRPVILSAQFNQIETAFADAVHYYRAGSAETVGDFIRIWSDGFPARAANLQRRARNHPDLFWDGAIAALIDAIA